MPSTADTMRNILLISYWYPPGVGAAAERMHSFARYLPEHRWNVHVLTAARSGSIPRAQGVTIHAVPDPLATSAAVFADFDPRRKPSRLKSWLREWTFPDRFIAWRRAALKAATGMVRQEHIDLVLASFPPASVAELALRLRENGGPPIVLDFRDRWLGPGGYEPKSDRARRRHIELEKRCIAAASAIVTVSEAMANAIAIEQGFARERIFVIPNGYDDQEPSPVLRPTGAPAATGLTISHVGTVIPRNRPDLFFHSVGALQRSDALAGVTFEFVGNLSPDYIRSAGLADVIRTTGLVSREEARHRMAQADALLLLTGAYVGRWGYNAKIFEYIRSGRAILCLEESPGSNDRRLLEEFAGNRTCLAMMGDAPGLKAAIVALREQMATAPGLPTCPPAFSAYSRSGLAGKLANHLWSLLG
ncbi:MAG TPA: glycosyltransferase [Phycisphaerae bacterium]|nr:glycosyltransferase [Phycisphaerae bacterium]